MRRLLIALLFAAAACSEEELTSDAEPGRDRILLPSDAAGFDDSIADAGFDEDGTAIQNDAAIDAGIDDTGIAPDSGPPMEDSGGCGALESARVGAVLSARFMGETLLEPTNGSPPRFSPIAEAGAHGAAVIVKTSAANGLEWWSQLTLGGTVDTLRVEQVFHEPSGDTYAVASGASGDGNYLRIRDADGDVAVEFTRNGPRGWDLVGLPGQRNFILIKYDRDGAVVWAKRFGPDDPMGATDLTLVSIAPRTNYVRITAAVGPGVMVFGPGETAEEVTMNRAGVGVWADFDKTTGNYLAMSSRLVRSGGAIDLSAKGEVAQNAAGETGVAGTANIPAGGAEIYVGAGTMTTGQIVTSTKTLNLFARIDAQGAPIFVRTARAGIQVSGALEVRQVALGASGTLAVAGRAIGGSRANVSSYFFDDPPRAPRILPLAQGDAFVAAYQPDGTLLFIKRVRGSSPFPAEHLTVDEAGGGIYLTGVSAADTVFGPGEARELTARAPFGWYLARFGLQTGFFEWARFFAGAPSLNDVWLANGEVHVPINYRNLTLWTPGTPDLSEVSPLRPNFVLGLFTLSSEGDLVRCRAIAAAENPALRLD